MMDTSTAEEILSLRRDIAGLKQALHAKSEEMDALRRQNERLEKRIRLFQIQADRMALMMREEW